VHNKHVRLHNAICRLNYVRSRSSIARRQKTGHALWLSSEAELYRQSLGRGTVGEGSDTEHRATVFRPSVHRFII
jgi:hypothetical protein